MYPQSSTRPMTFNSFKDFIPSTGTNLSIPDKKFVVKKGPNKKKTLTEEKELFDDLVREAADGLSVENFSERINMLDEFFKELMG